MVELSGQRFGRWLVLRRAEDPSGKYPRWFCRCDCGIERVVMQQSLRNGLSQSCGCLHRERVAAQLRTHGMTRSPTHNSWSGMLARCCNENNPRWQDYGGRGITVCQRWRESFEAFLTDMGECPPGTSLDRFPDPNGNYEPGNCRWATPSEQQRNRRNTSLVEYQGERRPLIEWAERLGMPYATLSLRLRRGWSAERALTTPVQERGR